MIESGPGRISVTSTLLKGGVRLYAAILGSADDEIRMHMGHGPGPSFGDSVTWGTRFDIVGPRRVAPGRCTRETSLSEAGLPRFRECLTFAMVEIGDADR